MTTPNDALQVPEFMKIFMEQSQRDTNSMASASLSVPRISYRGKRFRFITDGEEELVKENSIKVIILGVEPDAGFMVKTYYEKGYQPGDSEPPTCSSTDGVRPDSWISNKQSALCSNCPKNVFGSATSMKGGKAKACKDGKRLWVCKPDDLNKIYGLNIPVMSLKPLSEYGKFISKNKYPLAMVITEIGMDDDSEFPKLTFNHVGFIQENQVSVVTALNTERPWRTNYIDVPLIDNSSLGGDFPTPSGVGTEGPQCTPKLPSFTENQKSVEEVIGDWK